MNFKNWLIKEDPEGVTLKPGEGFATYFDPDAVTFCLIGGLYLSSETVYHEGLLTSLFENFAQKKPFPKSIKVSGQIAPRDALKFTKIYEEKKVHHPEKEDAFVLTRDDCLRYMPSLILGRLWTKKNIISFWNTTSNVFKKKNHVINFLRSLNLDPKIIVYDVDNNVIDFQNFSNGINTPQKIDRTKIHTMSPEQKGEALKKMGVVPRNPTDIRIKQQLHSESVGLKVLEIPDPLGLGLIITAKIKIVPGRDGQGAYSGHLTISPPDHVGGLTTFTDFYHSLEAAQTALRELLQKPHKFNVTRRLIRRKIGEPPTNEPEEEILMPVEIKGLRSVGTHRLEPSLGYGGSWDQDAIKRMPGYDSNKHEKHLAFIRGLQSVVDEFKKQTREESKKTKKFGDGPPLSGQWITKADVALIPDMIATFGDFKVVVKWSMRPRQIINASDFHKHYETIKKDAEVKTGDYMREVWVL